MADGIVVDYDDEGRIVGIEILDASKRTADPTPSSRSASRKRRLLIGPNFEINASVALYALSHAAC